MGNLKYNSRTLKIHAARKKKSKLSIIGSLLQTILYESNELIIVSFTS